MFFRASITRISKRFKKKKKYNPGDPTLDLVSRRDDLDPFSSEDGDGDLRAVMSCGHAVSPESLTKWCRSQLDQGIYKFRCPALGEGTKLCNKQWSYKEVRRMAVLSVSEMRHFEVTMARLATADFCDIHAHSAIRMWRERTSPACVSSAPYALLITRPNTTSAGSVGGSGKVGALGRTAATTTAVPTRTCSFCRHVPPSVCLTWRVPPAARQSGPARHVA